VATGGGKDEGGSRILEVAEEGRNKK